MMTPTQPRSSFSPHGAAAAASADADDATAPRLAVPGCVSPLRRASPMAGCEHHAADLLLSPDQQHTFRLTGPSSGGRKGWLQARPFHHYLIARAGLQESQPPLLNLALPGRVNAGAWSPDSQWLALILSPSEASTWWPRRVDLEAAEDRLVLVNARSGKIRRLSTAPQGGHLVCWSPAGNLLATVSPSRASEEVSHWLRVWQLGGQASPRLLLSRLWPRPLGVSFSPNEHFLMLAVKQPDAAVEHTVISLAKQAEALPPTALVRARVAEWDAASRVVFACDGAFSLSGRAGVWSPRLPSRRATTVDVGWSFVSSMKVAETSGRVAVLAEESRLAALHSQESECLVSILEPHPFDASAPLHLSLQVWLNGPYVPLVGHSLEMVWAPPGPSANLLAVAPPNSTGLWLLDGVGGNMLQLSRNLGAHRWLSWARGGLCVLVTDEFEPTHQSASCPADGPQTRLRVFRRGETQPIAEETRPLHASLRGKGTHALMAADAKRVVWMLPDAVVTLDYVHPLC